MSCACRGNVLLMFTCILYTWRIVLFAVTPQQVVLQRWQWQSPSTSCSHHKAPKQSLACTTWCFFMDCKLKEEAELGRAPWSLPRRVPMDKMWVGLVYEALWSREA
nr:uncharacterized protein LOC112286503 isoform X1 [Physcomitrium patens]|eukprot:XP_024384203.1 uncharacterized protein LOC112286503 isoform X1 [Physcomitrella patens]